MNQIRPALLYYQIAIIDAKPLFRLQPKQQDTNRIALNQYIPAGIIESRPQISVGGIFSGSSPKTLK